MGWWLGEGGGLGSTVFDTSIKPVLNLTQSKQNAVPDTSIKPVLNLTQSKQNAVPDTSIKSVLTKPNTG